MGTFIRYISYWNRLWFICFVKYVIFIIFGGFNFFLGCLWFFCFVSCVNIIFCGDKICVGLLNHISLHFYTLSTVSFFWGDWCAIFIISLFLWGYRSLIFFKFVNFWLFQNRCLFFLNIINFGSFHFICILIRLRNN